MQGVTMACRGGLASGGGGLQRGGPRRLSEVRQVVGNKSVHILANSSIQIFGLVQLGEYIVNRYSFFCGKIL
jgi:hypothetical protein